MSSVLTDLEPIGDPTEAWTRSIFARKTGKGVIALLAAPTFTADQQVVAYLGRALAANGAASYFCAPSQLKWQDGFAFLSTCYFEGPVSAIVRFYQGEWLCVLPRKAGWEQLFGIHKTPIANPGFAIISESKRFPLVLDHLSARTDTLKAFFPETRDLGEVSWQGDDTWVLKRAFSNCGDGVVIHPLLTEADWDAERRRILRRPKDWVAQKRFESIPLRTFTGPLYICFGVYTIDGRMAGIYGRAGVRPLIDYQAVDIAVLREKSISSSHG